jgi:hypothetical protein
MKQTGAVYSNDVATLLQNLNEKLSLSSRGFQEK